MIIAFKWPVICLKEGPDVCETIPMGYQTNYMYLLTISSVKYGRNLDLTRPPDKGAQWKIIFLIYQS